MLSTTCWDLTIRHGLQQAVLYRHQTRNSFRPKGIGGLNGYDKLNLSVVNGIEDAEREVEKRKGLEAVDPDNPAVVIIRQLLERALAEALQAVRTNNAPVEATSLVRLFGLYTKGLQTLLKK